MMDAKEALKELEDLTVDYGNRNEEQIVRLDEAIDMAMEALRNLPNRLRQAMDTISRQAVIDTVHKIIYGLFSDADGEMTDTEKTLLSVNKLVCNGVRELPSAQPETHDKRTETHSCDCISRQDAIDAFYKHPNIDWTTLDVLAKINALPPAQHDLSEYSDKLWKRAYERGKAEAHDEIVRCKECKWHLTYHDSKHNVGYALCGNPKMMIGDGMIEMSENDFCSKGKRKTDEQAD